MLMGGWLLLSCKEQSPLQSKSGLISNFPLHVNTGFKATSES